MESNVDKEQDFGIVAKSSVKLIKNSRGLNWEIKVVEGDTMNTIEEIKERALRIHHELSKELTAEELVG